VGNGGNVISVTLIVNVSVSVGLCVGLIAVIIISLIDSVSVGIGQVPQGLTPAEMQQVIEGTFQGRPATAAATRAEAYKAPQFAAPSYGQVQVGGPVAPIQPTQPTGRTTELYTADQKTAISAALGSDWQARLDRAALNGDYATIVDIQRQIDSILNPVREQP